MSAVPTSPISTHWGTTWAYCASRSTSAAPTPAPATSGAAQRVPTPTMHQHHAGQAEQHRPRGDRVDQHQQQGRPETQAEPGGQRPPAREPVVRHPPDADGQQHHRQRQRVGLDLVDAELLEPDPLREREQRQADPGEHPAARVEQRGGGDQGAGQGEVDRRARSGRTRSMVTIAAGTATQRGQRGGDLALDHRPGDRQRRRPAAAPAPPARSTSPSARWSDGPDEAAGDRRQQRVAGDPDQRRGRRTPRRARRAVPASRVTAVSQSLASAVASTSGASRAAPTPSTRPARRAPEGHRAERQDAEHAGLDGERGPQRHVVHPGDHRDGERHRGADDRRGRAAPGTSTTGRRQDRAGHQRGRDQRPGAAPPSRPRGSGTAGGRRRSISQSPWLTKVSSA